MTEFPFQLLIRSAFPEKRTESVSCTALLRTIPGRRQIYDAMWNHGAVIVKVFSHKISAKRHLKRECDGLSELAKRGLSSPATLFCGKTQDGHWAMVVEKIADSSTALDIFNKTPDKTDKLNLLVLVCRELAKQHERGILQKDLHLGNFLLDGDKVFLLDPGQMKFLLRPLNRKKSVSQLALLVRYLPASDIDSIRELCQQYFAARNWHIEKLDETFLQKQVAAHRGKIAKKGLKKCLRTSRNFVRIKTSKYVAVIDRDFCQETRAADFIEKIDALMDEGKILKKGNTCYVSHVTWNGKDIVIKRYNHKGLVYSLRHTIKRSRARRCWLWGHKLLMLGIATPKPLAYIEKRRAGIVWQSYYVTKFVNGQKLSDFLKDSTVTQLQRTTAIAQIEDILSRLWKHKIVHRDLKPSNILIADAGPVLTDLDAMAKHIINHSFTNWRKTKMGEAIRTFGVTNCDDYWGKREKDGKISERRLHRFISQHVDELFPNGAKVLDCGVGAGHVFRLCSGKHNVYGIELSSKAISMYDFPTRNIIQADLNGGIPDFGVKFDVIIISMVLHWLNDPLRFLCQAKDRLSPMGYLLAAIPNIVFYRYRIAYLFGKFPPISLSHKNFQTPAEVERMFEKAGLKIEERLSPRKFIRARLSPTLFSTDIVYFLKPA